MLLHDFPTTGTRCDDEGNDLTDIHERPAQTPEPNKWYPFDSQLEFEIADFLYRRNEMPQQQQDQLLSLWSATLRTIDPTASLPFANHRDILDKIDKIKHGGVHWDFFDVKYSGEIPNDPPSWMQQEYRVWFRNALDVAESMLKNRDFDKKFDYAPYKEYTDTGERRYGNFMSGDWAWKQAVNFILIYRWALY